MLMGLRCFVKSTFVDRRVVKVGGERMSVRRGALRSAACGSRESRCSEVLVRKSGCYGSRTGPTSISQHQPRSRRSPRRVGRRPNHSPTTGNGQHKDSEPQRRLMRAGPRLHITKYGIASAISCESDPAPRAIPLPGHACQSACNLSIKPCSCFLGL